MSNEIKFGGQSNFILAEGKRENPFGVWWLIAVGIIATVVCGTIALIILLSQPIQIPKGATLFITAPPKALASLPHAWQNVLPSEIREVIDTQSAWPITLGLYRSQEQWQWFMLGPRWVIKNQTKTNGLIAFFTSDMSPEETGRAFHYTKSLATVLPFGKTMSMELEPQLLTEASGLAISLDEQAIKGTFENGILQLDLPFKSAQQNPPLQIADFGMTIPKDGIIEDTIKDFIRRLSNGRHSDLNLPELAQYHVWIDDSGRPTQTMYHFETALSNEDAAQLLGAYGFFSKKTILLPDGTLSYEHIVPVTSSSTSLFGEHTNNQGELITLNAKELIVQKPNQMSPIVEDAPFCDHNPWMRLSGKSLKYILSTIENKSDMNAILPQLPDIQIGSHKNKLTICFQ